jgi:pilus assembly protein CpaD
MLKHNHADRAHPARIETGRAGRPRSMLRLLPFSLMLALAGCAESGPDFDDAYVPVAHYQRYPIEVAKGKAKLDVSGKHGYLTPAQADTVARFAQQALTKAASVIHVRRPSGGGRSIAVADDINHVLLKNGIREEMIVHSTYPGKASSPVLLSYVRNYAVTQACGSWNDLTVTYDNLPYENFGCAQQNNLAAMAANPLDLEGPRAMQPADAWRRRKVFDDYRKGETTSSAIDQQQQVAISTVANQ